MLSKNLTLRPPLPSAAHPNGQLVTCDHTILSFQLSRFKSKTFILAFAVFSLNAGSILLGQLAPSLAGQVAYAVLFGATFGAVHSSNPVLTKKVRSKDYPFEKDHSPPSSTYPTLVPIMGSTYSFQTSLTQISGEDRLHSNPRTTQLFFWHNGLSWATSCGDSLRHHWVVPSRIFGFECTWLAWGFRSYHCRPSLEPGTSRRLMQQQKN